MKLSIITVNLNNAEGLKKTAASIESQSHHDFEWIVIDGGSNDGSVEEISRYNAIITYMVSEKDSGIYNAMNKGIGKAKGEYLLFLNSGDCLAGDDVIEKVLSRKFEADIIYGDLNLVKNGKNIETRKYDDVLSFYYIKRFSLPHPASFIRRNLLIERPYDESYKIVADKKFFLEMALSGKSFQHIPLTISCFDTSGISSQFGDRVKKEEERMIEETVPKCIIEDYSNGRLGSAIILRKNHKLFGKFVTFIIILMEKLDTIFK